MPTAARIERLELPGIGELPDSRRTYPQGDMAGQVIGAVGSENEGLTGLEAGRGLDPRRHRRRTAHRQRRARRTDPAGNGQRSRGRQRHPADPRPGDRGEDRAGAGRSRRNLRAEGGDGDRRRPAQLADPGDGQLAAGRPRRPLRRRAPKTCSTGRPGFTYEPGSTFKAFTVSAALEEKEVTPDTTFTLPPQLQVADRTIEDAEAAADRDPHRRRNPRPLLQRRRGDDRPARWAPTSSAAGSTASASAARPGSSTRARSRGSCRRSTNTRARRWATCRSARGSR